MSDTANHDARRILLMMLMFIRVTLSPRKGVRCLHSRMTDGLPGSTRGEKPELFQWLVPAPRNLASNPRGVLKIVWAGIFSGLLIFGVSGARAEEPAPKPPEFVPIVVDQAQFSSAMAYLNGLKFGDAAPLVSWLNEQEARAKATWLADHGVRPAEARPGMVDLSHGAQGQ